MPTQAFPNLNSAVVGPDGALTQPWRQFLATLWARTGGAQGNTQVPTGTILCAALDDAPDGFLLCDDTIYDSADYPDLWNVLPAVFKISSSTFRIDLRGKMPRGVSGSIAIGSEGGQVEVTLNTSQMPVHTHSVTDPGHSHGVTDPGHKHTSRVGASVVTAGLAAGGSASGDTSVDPTGVTVNANTTGISLGNAGGTTPVPTLPPYMGLAFIIKT